MQSRARRPPGADSVRASPAAYRARFDRRMRRPAALAEGHLPSDLRDDLRDIAFGVTEKGIYLDASMVEAEDADIKIRRGLISHSALLVGAGLSRNLDDPKPRDDFRVRGIVKSRLGGLVIFWEGGHELLRWAPWVRTAIDNLLRRGLLRKGAAVYGAGDRVPVATAAEIARDW